MTKRIQDMLDEKLAIDFILNMLVIDNNITTKEDLCEYLSYNSSSAGVYFSMKNACERNNKLAIIDYLDNLEWFDYDKEVDEITETLLDFINEDDLRQAYYRYIRGGSDV